MLLVTLDQRHIASNPGARSSKKSLFTWALLPVSRARDFFQNICLALLLMANFIVIYFYKLLNDFFFLGNAPLLEMHGLGINTSLKP